eukprot:GDKH01007393.1.p1 GENE.GDKH01007393.1~~GDKH01007393.1.p1  ORF type:complete len:221 (+),score=13.78 GDKH01007393.1:185-847(+)
MTVSLDRFSQSFQSFLARVNGRPSPATYGAVKDIECGGAEPEVQQKYAFASVTISFPITPLSFVAMAYSFIPYPLVAVCLMWYIVTDLFYPFYCFSIFVVVSAFCEAFLKHFFKEPRPPASAVKSYGMPSSHSMTSCAVMMWTAMEITHSDHNSFFSALGYLLLNLAVFGPIPWARWYLEDHSERQVFAGSLAGVAVGVVAFILRFFLTKGSAWDPMTLR